MINAIMRFARKIRFKIFYLLLGLSAGGGGLVLAQVCPRPGQCATCGACLAGIPVVTLLVIAGRGLRKKTEPS